MGSQQMLLIAVGVVIVISMVVLGISMFSASFTDHVKDLAIHKFNDIGIRANVYRKTPIASGGGGGTYNGFTDQLNNILKEDNLVEKITFEESTDVITISMTLKYKSEKNNVFRVWGKYDDDGIESLRIYEPDTEEWVWLFKREL